MPNYLDRLPLLLREEFGRGRWLPVVGAGLSANAKTADGRRPPAWKKLGEDVASYLPSGSDIDDPVDAISAFEQLHGRPALIDRVRDALLVDEVRPSAVHKAFGRIPFDTVVTTNVDFLLEAAWAEVGWPFDPIVGEQRLTARRRPRATQLIKFHGDIHHPVELVLSEDDYDGFLDRFPLLATYLASLLITRVPVLIGYSLNDPDFRAVLRLIADRLGSNRPAPWVLLPRATSAEIARYERRRVRVVVLDRRPTADRGEVLRMLFEQLAEQMPAEAGAAAEASEDQILSELRRASGTDSRLIVFVGTLDTLARYREFLFPELRAQGLVPVTPDDVVPSPGLRLASLIQLLRRAAQVVVDVSGQGDASSDLQLVLSQVEPSRIVLVTDRRRTYPEITRIFVVDRSSENRSDFDVLQVVYGYLVERTLSDRPSEYSRLEDIERRLASGDYVFAFLDAVIELEVVMRGLSVDVDTSRSIGRMLRNNPLLEHPRDRELVSRAWDLRNAMLHKGVRPSKEVAEELTQQLVSLIKRLRRQGA